MYAVTASTIETTSIIACAMIMISAPVPDVRERRQRAGPAA